MDKEYIKLFDSELKVMDILWKEGDVPARHIAEFECSGNSEK